MTLKFDVEFHKAQMEVWKSSERFNTLRAGRGFGKSFFALHSQIVGCLNFKEDISFVDMPSSYIIMSTLGAVNGIHGRLIDQVISATDLKHVVKHISRAPFVIYWQGNKPPLKLVGLGADRTGQSLRGGSFYHVTYDESSNLPMTTLHEEIVAPRLDYQGSKELAIYTPKGKVSEMYKLSKREGTKNYHFTSYDNPFINHTNLRGLEKTLSPKKYRQEILATWEDFDGQLLTGFTWERSFTDTSSLAIKQYDIGIDPGAVNFAWSLIGTTSEGHFQVCDSWYNDTNEPVLQNDILKVIKKKCQAYNVHRVYCPDDRPDLVIAMRHLDIPAVIVKRSSPLVKPLNRAELMNQLFYCGRLTLDTSLNQTTLPDELMGLCRTSLDDGTVFDEIKSGQLQHRYDSIGYVVMSLISQKPEWGIL